MAFCWQLPVRDCSQLRLSILNANSKFIVRSAAMDMEAATVIQKRQRGKAARQRVTNLKQEKKERHAAEIIQAKMRSKMASNRVAELREAVHATVLGSAFDMFEDLFEVYDLNNDGSIDKEEYWKVRYEQPNHRVLIGAQFKAQASGQVDARTERRRGHRHRRQWRQEDQPGYAAPRRTALIARCRTNSTTTARRSSRGTCARSSQL